MGRYGGAELGFGSDADVMYVYRPAGVDPRRRSAAPSRSSPSCARLTEDLRLPLDLDADLRPEGKNGPIARSLDAYAAYYERWSLTWEAQALLRARGVAGDAALIRRSTALADDVRYPARSATQRSARSSASRRASRPSDCRRAPTPRGT